MNCKKLSKKNQETQNHVEKQRRFMINTKIKSLFIFVFAFIMSVSVLFGVSANAADYTSENGLWKYSYRSGTVTLIEYLGGGAEVKIPDTVDGYPVVGLGAAFAGNEYIERVIVSEGIEEINGTFAKCKKLNSVILPESLKTIGEYTFNASKALETVEINEGVTSIGLGAFWQCTSLKTIKLPESLTFIDDYSFRESGLTEITIPGGVETIPYNAFDCCYDLETVTLCDGVKTIEQHAFSECSSLTKIIIPKSVTVIEGTTLENVPFHLVKNLIIYGYENTKAKSFADEFGYRFVKIVPVTGISVSPETTNIEIGKTISLVAEVTPANATNKAVSWSSSDENVATVDSNGIVKGKANGSAIITVKTEDGDFTDTCTVTVHTHSYTSSVTTEPSCTEDGVKTYTCSCKHSYAETIEKLGHNHVDKGITTAPTCTATGLRTYECSRCRDSYTEPVKATGHNYIDKGITTSPTCSESGLRTFECSKCKDSYTSAVPATGHSYGIWTVTEEATTDKAGKKQRVCSGCGNTETQTIPMIVSDIIICAPSITTISYGDAIILHADVTGIPEGGKIVWTADNSNFIYTASASGESCTVTSNTSGNTIFTATVVDKDGNEIASDTQSMTAKAGFFQKIIAFFKKLFGMNKTYPQTRRNNYGM